VEEITKVQPGWIDGTRIRRNARRRSPCASTSRTTCSPRPIVVRNGIILVGYGEELRHGGLSIREAAIAAGKRRMRPIFLTSAAAAVGVVPLITSDSTLWGPLGAVTCFGLLLSMILTLFVLPVAYWRMVGPEWQRARSGPAREPPRALGSAAHPPLMAAPGRYVHQAAR